MDITEYIETDRAEVIALWKRCGLAAPQNDPGKDIDRKLS
jgi:hypothetical protein